MFGTNYDSVGEDRENISIVTVFSFIANSFFITLTDTRHLGLNSLFDKISFGIFAFVSSSHNCDAYI